MPAPPAWSVEKVADGSSDERNQHWTRVHRAVAAHGFGIALVGRRAGRVSVPVVVADQLAAAATL